MQCEFIENIKSYISPVIIIFNIAKNINCL